MIWNFPWLRGKIGRQIAFSSIIITLFTILTLGTWSVVALRDANISLIQKDAETLLGQSAEAATYRIRELRRICTEISLNKDLQFIVSNPNDLAMTNIRLKSNLFPNVQAILMSSPITVWVTLELTEKRLPQVYFANNNPSPFLRGSFLEIRHLKTANSSATPDSDYLDIQFVWERDATDVKNESLSLYRQIISVNDLAYHGRVRARVQASTLFSELTENRPIGSSFRIRDAAGAIVFSSIGDSDSPLGTPLLSRPIPDSDWVMELLTPQFFVYQGLSGMLSASIIIAGLVLAISTTASLIFSRYFSRRIDQIVVSLKAFEDGDFKVKIPLPSGDDEFGKIARAFNAASLTIETLIERVYQVELERKQATINLLQAQINPHFLYNSLSSISRLSRLGKGDNVHKMVLSLAKFYRLGLSKGMEMIQLAQEFEICKAWCEVQAIKREHLFFYSLDLPDDLREMCCPKMILQPFAENSVEHGGTDAPLHLKISARKFESNVLLTVSDDGCGMDAATLHELISSEDASLGYGVYNVRQRLLLTYGTSAHLEILSEVAQGTSVCISIPLLTNSVE